MRHAALFLFALCISLLSACKTEAPTFEPVVPDSERDEGFADINVFVVSPDGVPGSISPAQLEEETIRQINQAQETVDFVAERFHSINVADALISAAERGITVRVVGDEDSREHPGFIRVEAAGIPVTYGNGPNVWNPQPGIDVLRPGEHNRMAQNFILIDTVRVLYLTGGFEEGENEYLQMGFTAIYQDLGRDFSDIFEQLHGGTFATTLTAFDAPTAADPNNRTFYPTPFEAFEVFYGPSEPLIKDVVDRVYMARSSVWVVSYEFANDSLYDALVYKARSGFDVRVVVDADADSAPASRLAELEAEFDSIRAAQGGETPLVIRRPDVRMSAVMLDHQPSPFSANTSTRDFPASVIMLSQPLQASIPFRLIETGGGDPIVESRPSDVFTDATMVVIPETIAGSDPNLELAINFIRSLFE